MKFCIVLSISILSVLMLSCTKSNLPVAGYDLMKWPRMTSVAFGCFLEKEFGIRDPVFNCSNTSYTNLADPSETLKYYEGPKFPDAALARIHPDVVKIELEFEHGDLRVVTVQLDRDYRKDDVRRMFRLPGPDASGDESLPDNVQSVEYGENMYYKDKNPDTNFTKYFSLTGFDHIGAGETE